MTIKQKISMAPANKGMSQAALGAKYSFGFEFEYGTKVYDK